MSNNQNQDKGKKVMGAEDMSNPLPNPADKVSKPPVPSNPAKEPKEPLPNPVDGKNKGLMRCKYCRSTEVSTNFICVSCKRYTHPGAE
ncbi:hypothetical protein TWF730_004594 [Orbilia blumenaviensis]|uniref:Uncharacterized protein n=1 Tax=Orbilia blumenaviensis TaxID=1796055 RepID=A0AAV9TYH4_9PEZI